MARILIIEDEQDLAGLVEYNLRAAGFEAEAVGSGASGLARARAQLPDLLLLDLMLPDLAGSEVLRLFKSDGELRKVPVIIVSAKGQESDRIQGLELGADDYVVKPFSVRELLLRVKAVLRRADAEAGPEAQLSVGEIQLDTSRHQVRARGQDVALTALEFRLLRTLMERIDRVQTREVLLSDVWGIQAEIHTRTVDTHIKRLREKLGPAGDIIETVRGVGYKLTPP
ncbi:Phosphate regulon transcriptional regulatory protein PhoB (SphR) [Cystobacter fuscus DSM 2262]|uniref:Phosphate regulon transcriptional regulatory protein PhoB (SphR) n=1 Tax=Cystobacter fuscus (strain ATCC 25194 / DSM 2262 / NBRC 100088 / M29) TaxID=1242864 RepID=S9P6L4_CYSF2|nr:winged helix-turn-helix domain-containing protein [Cystobacter fuscus]EPX57872.1 Phosphate regulon transcriptional regulatory protein PhoB (SphR) [Cystobacter fuscus DSM 2262]